MATPIKYYDEASNEWIIVSTGKPLPTTESSGSPSNPEQVEINGSGGKVDSSNGSSDSNAPTQIGMWSNARLFAFDGTNFRRVHVDTSGNLKVVVDSTTSVGVQIKGSDIQVPVQYQGSVVREPKACDKEG